jgi:signal transduction histidine kinase/CheY-like chemotaxis protein
MAEKDNLGKGTRDTCDNISPVHEMLEAIGAAIRAFENGMDMVAVCEADDLRLIQSNEAFCKTLELDRAEFIGQPLLSLDIGIDETLIRQILPQPHQGLPNRSMEVTLKRQRGEKLRCLLTAAHVESSKINIVLITMKNISAKEQAEDLLRIQRDLTLAAGAASGPEEIVECLLDYSLRIEGLDSGGVYTVDESDGTMELVMSAGLSKKFVKAISRLSRESSQAKLMSAGRPSYLSYAEADFHVDDLLGGEGLNAVAVIPIAHGGKTIGALFLASHTLMEIPTGAKHTIESISGMIGGVFARARAEKALRESEEKLRQSEKMQAIGQLAGGVAHDFNNQLMGITGYADLLLDQVKENPKLNRYVENILLAARRSADLTAQLLAFARKGKYLSVSVDIHKTIQEVIALLSHSIDKRITIRRHLRAVPCVTTGDPTQLQSAVLNLALNARDAMQGGGDLIFTTDIVELDEPRSWDNPPFDVLPGKYLSIGVSDTGEGMTPEIKRRIFEPFFTTKEQGKGSGMGLAAVFGTIKNHRGAVTVDSAPHKGTSFRILLPLKEPEEEQKPVAGSQGSSEFSGLRVLLVDDEEIILKVAFEMLSFWGCTTRVCRNGREGVRLVQKNPNDFDLVILDMVMPEMNGKDALLRIKKIAPDLCVLLSSGYAMEEKITQYIADPTVQFIQKPFRLEELSRKIEQMPAVSSKRTL